MQMCTEKAAAKPHEKEHQLEWNDLERKSINLTHYFDCKFNEVKLKSFLCVFLHRPMASTFMGESNSFDVHFGTSLIGNLIKLPELLRN